MSHAILQKGTLNPAEMHRFHGRGGGSGGGGAGSNPNMMPLGGHFNASMTPSGAGNCASQGRSHPYYKGGFQAARGWPYTNGGNGGQSKKGKKPAPPQQMGAKNVAKNVRRAADTGQVEEALRLMDQLVRMGHVEPQALGMVGMVAVKAGRLKEFADILRAAKDTLRGQTVLQLNILHSLLSSVTIHCVDDYNERDEVVDDLVKLLCDVTDFSQGAHFRVYYCRIATGLLHEYVDEARSALERSRSVPVDTLVRMGACHTDVTCAPGLKAGEIKCTLPNISAYSEDRRGISSGDLVAIVPAHAAEHGVAAPAPLEAEVAAVLSRDLVLKVPDKKDQNRLLAHGVVWRMDKMANKVAFARQLKALRTICAPPAGGAEGSGGGGGGVYSFGGGGGGKSSGKKKGGRARPAEEIIVALTTPAPSPGVEVVPKVVQAAGAACRRSLGQPMQQPPHGTPTLIGLNSSQVRAICGAVTRRLTLVQGPPGTGKTHTALRVLAWWLRSQAHGSGPVLATSDSNIAVDNLLEGLVKLGVRVVRLGRPDRVRPELLRFCVDVPAAGQLQVDWSAKMAALRQAQVVCSTCVGIGSDQLDGFSFAGVLLDEASQVPKPSTLNPTP
jgi:hypothetical protein